MPANALRVACHLTHAVGVLVLLGTGLLLLAPDLRAALVGGYSRTIRAVHAWAGVVFTLLPAAAVVAGGRCVLEPPAGATRPIRWWKRGHVGLTVAASAVLAATGVLLWVHRVLPDALAAGAQSLHVWLTAVVAAALALHLTEVAGTAVRRRLMVPASTFEEGEPHAMQTGESER